MYLNSQFADLSAELSIPEQGHDVMLDAAVFDSFPQHR